MVVWSKTFYNRDSALFLNLNRQIGIPFLWDGDFDPRLLWISVPTFQPIWTTATATFITEEGHFRLFRFGCSGPNHSHTILPWDSPIIRGECSDHKRPVRIRNR